MERRLKLSLLLLAGLLFASGTAWAEIEGNYETIGPIPKTHSLQVVVFHEYLNFSCPHCNNFRKAAKPLKEKFGKRLKVTYVPILFRNQSDFPLRLFFLAESMGRTEEMKNLIFDAAFNSGVNVYDPAVVSYLARSSGLGEKYKAEANAPWVTEKVMEAQRMAAQAGIRATPTIVLQHALRISPQTGMQAYVGNLERIIEQLLRK